MVPKHPITERIDLKVVLNKSSSKSDKLFINSRRPLASCAIYNDAKDDCVYVEKYVENMHHIHRAKGKAR